ncbi:Inversin-A [Entamoeba marina]
MDSSTSPYQVGLSPTVYQQKFLRSEMVKATDDITPLHVSVFFNKVEFIESLIEDYQINVNYQDNFGNTALMIAAVTGNVEAARELLSNNASKTLVNKYGQTAILVALRYGKGDVAQTIIKSLTNPFQTLSSTDNAGYTVLHYAGYCNDLEVLTTIDELCYVDDMIENTINPSCSTPLHIAAANGCHRTVEWLLSRGACATTENCMGQSPLLLAIKNGHKECIELLLDISSANVPDNYGQLALHYAAIGNDLDILQQIYTRFPKALTKMDTNGNFPYHHAVKSNDKKILDFFYLTEGANLLIKKNSNGMTPVMLAVACGAIESFKYLRELGGDVYVQSMSGTTPFLLTCAYGKLEMAELLFKEDPSVISDMDNTGNTAAHFAVQNNRLPMLRWLHVVAPEIIEKKNRVGETALHIACLCGYKQLVETLQSFGLSMTQTTNNGRTPFHYAVLGGHLSLVRQLRRNSNPAYFAGDKNKLTPLHYCCIYGFAHLIDDLLSAHPALIDARDGCGRTPLHVAVVTNDACSVRKLIAGGADKQQVDIRKMTAEQSAINRGYIHCYELLNGKTTDFTIVKKVKMVVDYLNDDENLLRVKNNEVVNVYWEHKKGWAIGSVNNQYGLFPLAKGTTIELSKEEKEKITQVLSLKKMVKKGVDKKNRSASVAFKGNDQQTKRTQQAVAVDPTALLGLQQTQSKRRKTRKGVVAKDVL